MLRLVATIALACVAACGNADPLTDEAAFAKSVLAALQARSIRENVEYCGYIGLDDDGAFIATEAMRGGSDWCDSTIPDGFDVTASYHTHAGYDPTAWSEIPSGTDMESDEADGIDGYVATPGGRFWYIDTEEMVTSQLCGIGCLPQDPRFRPAPEDRIQQSYSYDEIVEKIDG